MTSFGGTHKLVGDDATPAVEESSCCPCIGRAYERTDSRKHGAFWGRELPGQILARKLRPRVPEAVCGLPRDSITRSAK